MFFEKLLPTNYKSYSLAQNHYQYLKWKELRASIIKTLVESNPEMRIVIYSFIIYFEQP